MPRKTKKHYVSLNKGDEIKVEMPGGIVNVTTGLTANDGEEVTHVSVSCDGNRFAGDEWHVAGYDNQPHHGFRFIKGKFTPFEFRIEADKVRGIHRQINVFYRGRVWRIKFNQCGLTATAVVDTLIEKSLQSQILSLYLGTFPLPSGSNSWADIYNKYEVAAQAAIKLHYELAEGNG